VLLVGAGERFTPAFQAALARHRVFVETAELGAVVDAVVVTAPDLVLLMGEAAKDGGSLVLQKLAGLSQNFTVPVVVLHDDSELDSKLSAFRHGAAAVLPRSASIDATAEQVARLAREIPEQGTDSQGALGEATLEEFIGALSRQLRTGLANSLSPETADSTDMRLVLGRGRPLAEFLDNFVRRVRRHVVKAEPLQYELGGQPGAPADGLGSGASGAPTKPQIERLRVILADDDTPRADAVAQELRARGVVVVVTDLAPNERRLQALRQADPTVLIVGESHAHGEGYELLRRIRRDSRLRWASLLVVRWDDVWPEQRGAPAIKRLESTLAGLAEPERSLLARAELKTRFDTRLETTGPARCLRALESSGHALRVHVENPRVEITVDISDGLVVGAEGRTLDGEPLSFAGIQALSALLVLGSGRVRVDPVDQPASANVMTPVEAALNMADAETPPITPSIPATGTVSLHPPFQATSLEPVTPSLRPAPIVPVGAPEAPKPRPAAPAGAAPPAAPAAAPLPVATAPRPLAPPSAAFATPPRAPLLRAPGAVPLKPQAPIVLNAPPEQVAPMNVPPAAPSGLSAPSAAALPLAEASFTPAHERTPPSMTVPSSFITAPAAEPSGVPPRSNELGARLQQLRSWFAAQDAKLHGKTISAKTAFVLVALAALQGLLLVTLFAGAKKLGTWFSEPTAAIAEPAARAPHSPASVAPQPAAVPPPAASAETEVEHVAGHAEGEQPDGSGGDVPDCKTLLADNPPHTGHYPGAALQQMRSGRLAIVRGDLKAAQASLCRAERWDQKNAEIPLELALVLLLARDGADAAYWARRAVELDPANLKAKDTLGDALARVGAHREAGEAWLAAARIDPSNQSGRRALVARELKQADHALRKRGLVIAERYFRRAAILEPRSITALVGLSYALAQQGDAAAAVTWARRAVAVSPRNAAARLALGDALAKGGDKAAAAVEWREAGLLDPSNREAAKRLRLAGLPPN
jgi:tetratricopeptide (TPR) repeat protein/DNA-binding NarL/FixJ family response regulator